MVNGSAPSLSCLKEKRQYMLPYTVVSECTIAQLQHIPLMWMHFQSQVVITNRRAQYTFTLRLKINNQNASMDISIRVRSAGKLPS